MKRRSRILILILLAFLYVVFAVRDTKKSTPSSQPTFLSFAQARSISEMPHGFPDRLPFNGGFNFGYIDIASKIVYSQPSTARVAIDEHGWITYARVPDSLELHELGQKSVQLSAFAYPWFKSTWRILLRGDQMGIAKIDDQGTIQWQREFPMQITAIDANSRYFVAGLLDGSIYIFDKDGNRIVCASQSFSTIRTIFALAISEDGKYIVALKGISPQNIETFKNEKTMFTLVNTTKVANASVSQGSMSISKNGTYAIAARGESIIYYNIKNNISRNVPFPTRDQAASSAGEGTRYFAIGSIGENGIALLRMSGLNPSTSDVLLLRNGLLEREWEGATGIASSGDSFAVLFQDGVELQ